MKRFSHVVRREDQKTLKETCKKTTEEWRKRRREELYGRIELH